MASSSTAQKESQVDVVTMESCGNQPAKSHGDETIQGVDCSSDNLLKQLDLRWIVGGNRSPELLGLWTLDNQLKMFTTICHFSSEIFKSPDPRKDQNRRA
jgi:hypothetical protein